MKNFTLQAICTLTYRLLLALYLCSLSACAIIDRSSPSAVLITAQDIHLSNDIQLAKDDWPQAKWWVYFKDPQLDALIESALLHAPNMSIARNRFQQAIAQVDLVKSSTNAQAVATATLNRLHVSDSGPMGLFALNIPALGLDGPWYTQGTAGISGLYEFDIWGQDQHKVQAAIGQQNAQLAETAAIELEVTTTVAQLYFSIQTTQQKLALLQQVQSIYATHIAAHDAKIARG
ncbi:MAG: TolC family protein, partial [Saezia sp.]